jgi:hypothetical protein
MGAGYNWLRIISNIKMCYERTKCENMDWIQLLQDRAE